MMSFRPIVERAIDHETAITASASGNLPQTVALLKGA
jgi:hypothetical protein